MDAVTAIQYVRIQIFWGVLLTSVTIVYAEPVKSFRFDGGTVSEFVQSIDSQFNMDGQFQQIALIHSEMGGVQVPKIKIRNGSPLRALVVYEQLAERNMSLGILNYASADKNGELDFQMVSFQPAEFTTTEKQASRVFALNPIMAEALDELKVRIAIPLDVLSLKSQVMYSIDKERRIIIAKGSENGLQAIEGALDSLARESEYKKAILAEIALFRSNLPRLLEKREFHTYSIKMLTSKGRVDKPVVEDQRKQLSEVEAEIRQITTWVERSEAEFKEVSE